MVVVYVCSSESYAGKSTSCLVSGRRYAEMGLKVGYFKPVGTLAAQAGDVLLAVGARFEGVFRKHMIMADGRQRDSAYYSILDDEWPAVRVGLQERLAQRMARAADRKTKVLVGQ